MYGSLLNLCNSFILPLISSCKPLSIRQPQLIQASLLTFHHNNHPPWFSREKVEAIECLISDDNST